MCSPAPPALSPRANCVCTTQPRATLFTQCPNLPRQEGTIPQEITSRWTDPRLTENARQIVPPRDARHFLQGRSAPLREKRSRRRVLAPAPAFSDVVACAGLGPAT